MQSPETHYARSGDLRIAYQQWGNGPPLLIIPALIGNIEIYWEHELISRSLQYLGKHFTCVQFDKRGIGLSDRFDEAPTLAQRIDDLTAVMSAVGWERAHLLGLSEGGLMAQLFAADFPERVESLVVVNSVMPIRYRREIHQFVEPGDPPINDRNVHYDLFLKMVDTWSENPAYTVNWQSPSQGDNQSFIRWTGRMQRMSCSPKDLRRQIDSVFSLDAGDAAQRITSRAMVMHVKGDLVLPVAGSRVLAKMIPNAVYREIKGDDHFAWCMPNWLEIIDAIIGFTISKTPLRQSARKFASILFTDIVDSTKLSSSIGDEKWRSILEAHDRVSRGLIEKHRGRLVKSTGDGLLAIFDAPSEGILCGTEMCDALSGIGIKVRAGLHAGQIEIHEDGDISGIAVNLAARIEQLAAEQELWTSSTVRDMMLGGSETFSDRGEHVLKGIKGHWRLYSVQ